MRETDFDYLDHEIFKLRDEIIAKEGANVTFYGNTLCLVEIKRSVRSAD